MTSVTVMAVAGRLQKAAVGVCCGLDSLAGDGVSDSAWFEEAVDAASKGISTEGDAVRPPSLIRRHVRPPS